MSTVVKDLGAATAYGYAVEKGYTGTEAEFAELMADYAEVGQRADDAAESALNSKTAAQTAATTATSKASEATTAAQTATTKAGEAQTSAQTASNKASEASQSASQASGYAQTAETAKTDAQTAKTQAETARDNAVTAKTAAETAQGKAEDAQAAAESVAESIPSDYSQLSEDVSDLKSEITALESDGVAPSTEQLLSKNTTADAVPYLFRQTGGDGADREYLDAIVGGTVAWNQLFSDGNFVTEQNWSFYGIGSHSVSNNVETIIANSQRGYMTRNVVLQSEHVYFLSTHINLTTASNLIRFGFWINDGTQISGGVTTEAKTGWQRLCSLSKPSLGEGKTNYIRVRDERESDWDAVQIKRMMFIDLTQMFGSTIADHIYSLEQATAGAGVAFFKSLFPNDYYPYNAGELKSVEGVSAHETVGFNRFDASKVEWTDGIKDDSGEIITGASHFTNAFRVFPNTTYCINGTLVSTGSYRLYYLTESGEWISRTETLITVPYVFTTPSNCGKMQIQVLKKITSLEDVCLNFSDPTKNGTYEPYEVHRYPLDNSLILRGIPKLSDGKMYFDGDRYLPDGTVTRKYGIRAYQSGDESLADAITDGTNTVYKLTTTTIEEATPYRQLQICDPNGTEEFVSTGIIPVGHETRYPENLRAKIEGLPWDFSSLIAPTEKTTTASRNYTVGNLLIMGNVLYKVTANIANGGTITPNTNVTATTLSEILSALAQ